MIHGERKRQADRECCERIRNGTWSFVKVATQKPLSGFHQKRRSTAQRGIAQRPIRCFHEQILGLAPCSSLFPSLAAQRRFMRDGFLHLRPHPPASRCHPDASALHARRKDRQAP